MLQGDSVPRALGLSLVASNVFSAFDNNKFDFSANISSRMFENVPQNGPEYSHRNLVSGHCGEKKHRGLTVLVGLIFKLSP